ncbi:PA2169 family four-helix-bundle protein [Flavobacterium sp.]|uniref:ferritin-like domain-containing protein n=1 Tax=Flavobacterium sp. TaxID=239 RepID=UPI00286D1B68|nr:PA2169 family four-helix-bundle protein [Flavobacterium sp.]
MEKARTIEALNTLIVINNDRIEGYKTATAEAKETDLKELFSDLCQTSIDCRKELTQEVIRLGGTPDEGTRITGKFYRAWMNIKVALSTNDRQTILESCEFGEDVALNTYKKVLIQDYPDTNTTEQDMLNKQYALLKTDHDKVKKLRDLVRVESEATNH